MAVFGSGPHILGIPDISFLFCCLSQLVVYRQEASMEIIASSSRCSSAICWQPTCRPQTSIFRLVHLHHRRSHPTSTSPGNSSPCQHPMDFQPNSGQRNTTIDFLAQILCSLSCSSYSSSVSQFAPIDICLHRMAQVAGYFAYSVSLVIQ